MHPPYWNINWQQYAACRGSDPEVFFPRRGKDVHEAKTICAGCTVVPECRQQALYYNEKQGIWGGLTWSERRRARRGLPEHDCPVCGINHVPREANRVLCQWCKHSQAKRLPKAV